MLRDHAGMSTGISGSPTDNGRRSQLENIIDLFGAVDFDPEHDYKRQRAQA